MWLRYASFFQKNGRARRQTRCGGASGGRDGPVGAAGLFDRAFGEWLIQPTVFDMLEYRFPQSVGEHAQGAFRRVRERCHASPDLDLLERTFAHAAGRSMRELLGHREPGEARADEPPIHKARSQ